MNDGASNTFASMITGVFGQIVWGLPQFVQDFIVRVMGYRLMRIVYMPGGRTLYRWSKGDSFPLGIEDIPDMNQE